MKTRYRANNSGGSWWLTDENWYALEAAGWDVEWVKDGHGPLMRPGEDRWLGALAWSATREGLTLSDAIAEWERVTSQCSADLGCGCCGPPHGFDFEGDNGERVHYSPESPVEGAPYLDRST